MGAQGNRKARLRLPDKYAGMNGTEKLWAFQLEANMRSPESQLAALGEASLVATQRSVVHWRFEQTKVRLADRTWYTVDFEVLFADGHIERQEVKAVHRPTKKQRAAGRTTGTSGWKEDARVKFKVAGEIFPEYVWVACEKQLDGSWTETRAEDLFKRGAKT